MLNPQQLEAFKKKLRQKRDELYSIRKNIDSSWKDLHGRESEMEEAAQEENIAQPLDNLDSQEAREIEAVDMALHRLEAGTYGVCTSCGTDISLERLEAIPWTPFCRNCIQDRSQEGVIPPPPGIVTPDLPPKFEGFTDPELCQAVLDEVQSDGRIDTQELKFVCRNRKVHLQGFLPSEKEHQILLEIIEDNLGLPSIVDEVAVDRTLWQKKERSPDQRELRRSEEGKPLRGPDLTEEPFDREKDETSIEPSDSFIPGKKS